MPSIYEFGSQLVMSHYKVAPTLMTGGHAYPARYQSNVNLTRCSKNSIFNIGALYLVQMKAKPT